MDIKSVGKRFNIEVLIHGEKVKKTLTLIEIVKKNLSLPKKEKVEPCIVQKGLLDQYKTIYFCRDEEFEEIREYNSDGSLICVKQRGWDEEEWEESETDKEFDIHLGNKIETEYDSDGKIKSIHEKIKNFAQMRRIVPDQFINDEKIFDFDSKERLVHIKFPDDSESFFDYDSNDNVICERRGNDTFLYEYDSNGYLVYENTLEENYFHIYEKEGNIITIYMFVDI